MKAAQTLIVNLPAASIFPTALQICASIVRVLVFGWAALKIEQLPEQGGLLLFLGYLPFFAIFDVLCQSWSRSAQIGRAKWIEAIGRWRPAFALTAVAVLLAAVTVSRSMSDLLASITMLTLCFFLGSAALFWERWLATPRRAAGAAIIELTLLMFSVISYSQAWIEHRILLLCFTGYILARILALLVPGRSAMTDALPKVQMRRSHYLGFALGQQLLGSTSASMPSIYSTVSGSTVGLATALTLFRVMHGFAAMASFLINAIGGRLFFGEARTEMGIFASIASVLQRRRLLIDAACIFSIFVAVAFWPESPFLTIPAFVLMLGVTNFRSSLAINRGRPRDGFILQGGVLIISGMALLSIYGHSKYIVLVGSLYFIYFFITERCIEKISDGY